jgi:mono/diheme cytochrome c family protein
MKTAFKVVGVLVLLILLAAGGLFAWASRSSSASLARTFETHTVDFSIPFPLDSAEAAGLDEDEVTALAFDRAVERGAHLVEARYVCVECHGENLGGGTMIDDPAIGTILGPNITGGPGSRVGVFRPADWDRIVRHGVLLDGRPAAMPSGDFERMSDQELSDIIAYIRSLPPVENTVPAPTLGPVGKILMATGKLTLSADEIESHDSQHRVLPPAADTTVEFGRHLAGVCTGCHSETLAGGPIVGGDPAWPPAGNLTPHPDGLADWTQEQFLVAMREAKRPDGTELLPPMDVVAVYGQRMTDVELQALWMYLRTLPPLPTPEG